MLTLEQKLSTIKRLNVGESAKNIVSDLGVRKSIVWKIGRKNKVRKTTWGEKKHSLVEEALY